MKYARLFYQDMIHDQITGLHNSIRMADLFVKHKSAIDSLVNITHDQIRIGASNKIECDQQGKCHVHYCSVEFIFSSAPSMMAYGRENSYYTDPIECISYSKCNTPRFMARSCGTDIRGLFSKISNDTLLVAKSALNKADRVHDEIRTLVETVKTGSAPAKTR